MWTNLIILSLLHYHMNWKDGIKSSISPQICCRTILRKLNDRYSQLFIHFSQKKRIIKIGPYFPIYCKSKTCTFLWTAVYVYVDRESLVFENNLQSQSLCKWTATEQIMNTKWRSVGLSRHMKHVSAWLLFVIDVHVH